MQHAWMALNSIKWHKFNDLDQFEVEQPWVNTRFLRTKGLAEQADAFSIKSSNDHIITSTFTTFYNYGTMKRVNPWWIMKMYILSGYITFTYYIDLYRLHRLYMTTCGLSTFVDLSFSAFGAFDFFSDFSDSEPDEPERKASPHFPRRRKPCISRAFSASGVLDLRDDEDLESGTGRKKWHTTSPDLGLIKLWQLWFEDFWF